MGRVFTVHGENQTLSTGSVMIALRTATGVNAASILKVYRFEATQSGSSTSAQVRMVFSTRDTAGTLTTSSVTPRNTLLGGPASGLSGNTSVIGAAGRIGITSTADSGGTYTDHYPNAPNQLNGYLYLPVPEERLIIPPDTVWCARFATAPANLAGWDYLLVFEEVS